jgi:serine protease
LIALVALVLAALPAQAAATQDADGARVIVKFKALGPLMRAARERGDRGPQQAAMLAGRHGLGLRDGRMIDARSQVVWGDRTLTSAALAARLAQDADVEYAVPDERRQALALPNDPLLPASAGAALPAGQWYLQPADATLVSAINAVGAWAVTTGSSSLVVADVDTGVLTAHPDLASKLLPGYDFVSSTTTSGDSGGRDADASDPGDWTTAGQCGSGQSATNSSWHGTQTASLIGAQTNNGVGMASVGYDVKILPVRVLGKCGGSDSDIIAGMLWAAGLTSVPTANPNPAKVINLSLGGSGSCSAAYQDAINQLTAAGVVVVAAAGNEAGLAVGTPANCSGVIAVAGVRHVGTKVGFSSIGPEVAIAAPGGNCVNSTGACLYPILTATNSGTTTASSSGYTYSSSTSYSVGTSFAAPMVSGAGLDAVGQPGVEAGPGQVAAAVDGTRLPRAAFGQQRARLPRADGDRPGRVPLHDVDLRRRPAGRGRGGQRRRRRGGANGQHRGRRRQRDGRRDGEPGRRRLDRAQRPHDRRLAMDHHGRRRHRRLQRCRQRRHGQPEDQRHRQRDRAADRHRQRRQAGQRDHDDRRHDTRRADRQPRRLRHRRVRRP